MRLNASMESKSGWGGKRQGAGRKVSPNVRISMSVPRDLWAAVEMKASEAGLSAESLLVQWIQQHMAGDSQER